jgi:ATP-dependent helicase IRC3
VSQSPLSRDNQVVPGAPASVVLRDYQRKALSAVLAAKDRGLSRVMVVMPTGTGKTTLFAALVDQFDAQYDEAALVVAHRHELLHQAAGRIAQQAPRIPVGIEGGRLVAPEGSRAVVAGVQTLGRPKSTRLDWFNPGLLILDEGHHAPADTWQNVMRRFGAYDGLCFTLAVTATDHRMDNKPLHGEEAAIFEDVVFRYTLRQAVADGWLADLRGYRVATGVDISRVRTRHGDYVTGELARAVNTEERNLKAYEHWSDVARNRRTIVFCVDVQHAKDVAKLFRDWGVAAEHVDGTMKPAERDGVMRRFGSGRTQVLCNVDIATEGFDIPAANCVLMLRPTQSWALYTQMVGRGLRVLPGVVDGLDEGTQRRAAIVASAKPDCIVIDVVDLTTRLPKLEEEGPVRPEGKAEGVASAAGLVGLPEDFDLQGQSIYEAAQWAEELTPTRRAELFRRPMSFDDLSTVLSEVDLLRELSIPEEILGVSRLAWMKIGHESYFLPCGSSGLETNRSAQIVCDELGRYTLKLSSSLTPETTAPVGTDLAQAFDEADRIIHLYFPDCGPIVRADANWRERPPSPRQLEALRELHVEEAVVAMVSTMGQARALIEQAKLGRAPARRKSRGGLA